MYIISMNIVPPRSGMSLVILLRGLSFVNTQCHQFTVSLFNRSVMYALPTKRPNRDNVVFDVVDKHGSSGDEIVELCRSAKYLTAGFERPRGIRSNRSFNFVRQTEFAI